MNNSLPYAKNRDQALKYINQNSLDYQMQLLIGLFLTQISIHPLANRYLEQLATKLEEINNQDQCQLNNHPLNYFLLSKFRPQYAAQLSVNFTLHLTKHEQVPGGPYYTVTQTTNNEKIIDPITNAGIHLSLQNFGVHLVKLETYLVECLTNEQWRTGTYPAWLQLYILYLSLSTSVQAHIQTYLEKITVNEPVYTPLDLACKILITNNYSLVINKDFVPSFTSMSTLDSISAALWAIIWNHSDKKTKVEKTTDTQSTFMTTIKDQAILLVAKKFSSLDPELQATGLAMLGKLLITPIATEIILLSANWGQSFNAPLKQEVYAQLGAANLFGWIAHHLYQTVTYHNPAAPTTALANISLRSAAEYYQQIATQFKIDNTIVLQTFDSIDQAHAAAISAQQELKLCKKQHARWTGTPIRHLAECSFGHCLGPLLITHWQEAQYGQLTAVKKLFNHYLAARQICDDLHDWRNDYDTYQVTSVTRNLFFTAQAFKCINEFQAKKIFWNEGIDLHINEAKQEIEAAHILMKKITWPNSYPQLMFDSLQTMSQSLKQVSTERVAIKSLIKTYTL